MSINNNISKFANTVDSSGQIDFADLANKPTTLAGYGITDGASGGSVTSYTNASDLPLTGNSAGDLAYVVETNRMYVNTGSGWYSISLVNTDPSITSVQDAGSNTSPFTLSTDGTATVITITASDPEDVPLTYSYSVTSGSLTNGGGTTATVTQGTGSNTNVFTVTPSTTEAYAADFTLTFTVSDGVNTSTSGNSFSLSFVTTITNSNYTTLLLKADAAASDNQSDASSNSLTITESGNVTSTAFSPYHPKGYSVYFDGSGDYLSCGSGSQFDMGTGDFTWEAWVYPMEASRSQQIISVGDTNSTIYGFYFRSTNKFAFYGNSTVYLESSSTSSVNQWYHVAVVRSGTNLTLYVDGTSVATATTSDSIGSSSEGCYVGTNKGVSTQDLKGYISDARVVKGTAVYTTAFTPTTERLEAITNTQLLTCHLPYIADGSSNDASITVSGGPQTEQFSPYDHDEYSKSSHGGSVYFDGSGDELNISPSGSELVFGTDAYTVEFWIYLKSVSGGHHIYGANSLSGFLIYYTTSKIAVNKYSVSDVISYAEAPPLNKWTHYAIVREGTGANQTKIYKNGVVVATDTDATDWATNASWTVGGNPNSAQDFNGYLSDLRVVKGTAVYTSNFTPPTEPLTAVTNTQLLTCTNKHEVWDAASGEVLTLNGNADASTTQYKWVNSTYFDGTGDYIGFDPTDLYLGTASWTIEMWVYVDDLSSNRGLFQLGAGNGSLGAMILTTGAVRLLENAVSSNVTTSATISTNTWNHIAFTFDGDTNTGKVYINGTQDSNTFTKTSAWVETSVLGYIGCRYYSSAVQNSMSGYIEDLRITKGLARYTSSFTAPTAAFKV